MITNETSRAQSIDTLGLEGISLEVARKWAPAAFAKSPAPHIRSKNYNFTSTEEVIGHMQSMGYVLTSAKQTRTKSELWHNYGAHMVGFQHPDLYVKGDGGIEARPTLIMTNSHDGSRPVQFEMGLFRLVCSNGLMIKSMDLGSYRERHSRMDMAGIRSVLDEKVGRLPNTVNTINSWISREMDWKERQEFARRALALRIGEERLADLQPADIHSILEPRRRADEATNLWTTYNVAQENLIRGGYTMGNRQQRAITNPWADMTLNQGLWQVAESMA